MTMTPTPVTVTHFTAMNGQPISNIWSDLNRSWNWDGWLGQVEGHPEVGTIIQRWDGPCVVTRATAGAFLEAA